MTKDQLQNVRDVVAEKEISEKRVKKREQRWDTNYVNHDFKKKKAEQGDDWYNEGKNSKFSMQND